MGWVSNGSVCRFAWGEAKGRFETPCREVPTTCRVEVNDG